MTRTFLLCDPAKPIKGQPFPVFQVTATQDQYGGWSMTVHEVASIDAASGQPNVDEDDPYIVSCFIKYDGCSHFNFGDGYLHMCGQEGILDHAALMRTLFELGYQLRDEVMPAWDRAQLPAFVVSEVGIAEQAIPPLL